MRLKFLLLASVWSTFSVGCTDTSLIVDVGNIPPVATELRAVVRMPDKQSADIPRFPFPAGRSTYSFGLNLKDRQSGAAQITVGAFLNNCLLSSGVVQIDDVAMSAQEVGVNLDAMSADVSADACPDAKPVLLSAETATNPATGGNVLTVHGFGFAPSAQVLLDHSTTPATGYTSRDPRSFSVDLPRLVPPINHALHVQTLQPDGSSGSADFTVSIPVFDGNSPTIYPQNASDPFRLLGPVWAEDLDGDKHVDLIMASAGTAADSGALTAYFNDGTGKFTASKTVSIGADIRDVAAVKVRTGSLRDIVATACHTPNFGGTKYSRCNLVVVQQLTARNFTNVLTSSMFFDGSESNGQHAFLTVGDFNLDGVTDVAAVTNASMTPFQSMGTSGTGSMLKLYDGTTLTRDSFRYGNGKTLSGPAVAISSGRLVSTPSAQLDLVISQFAPGGTGLVEVYQNPGNGRFDQATPSQLTTVGRPGKIATGDFDSDGRTDFAVTLCQNAQMTTGSQVSIYLRRASSWSVQTISTLLNPFALAGVDLLSDGVPDLLVSNSRVSAQAAQLGLLFNQGLGAFAPMNQTSLMVSSTTDSFLAVADFNEDQKQDVAVSTVGVSGSAGIHVGTLSLLLGL